MCLIASSNRVEILDIPLITSFKHDQGCGIIKLWLLENLKNDEKPHKNNVFLNVVLNVDITTMKAYKNS